MGRFDLANSLGLAASPTSPLPDRAQRQREVELLLIANGLANSTNGQAHRFEAAAGLLQSYCEKSRLLSDYRCPADGRIELFLAEHFALPQPLRLPANTLVLNRYGLARELSLPQGSNEFRNPLLSSFRVSNGVLHNPASDRRTTQGTFHVTEGGLPVPGDKKAVPQSVFAALFSHAVNPPADLLLLPFTANSTVPAHAFVSLLLRPMVCPPVPGVCPEKTMEVRFFAPGSLVSNLDFVESIFGNAGDPYLPTNDAGLDVEHWTGHSGCVILAPHLVHLTKKELGLPHYDQANDRQKRDGMCWKDAGERYNDGSAFKLTCRTAAGVIVTLIADNYYGYCKKEVKTQISYAANLFGNVEEEHAGGALAFPSYSFGDAFVPDPKRGNGRTFDDVIRDYGDSIDVQPDGYAIDKLFPNLIYIPAGSRASVARQQIWWTRDGKEHVIPLMPGNVYMNPSGFKLRMEKHPGAPSWRLIGTSGEGTFCHKPCTVSGGGKSEISKSLRDYMLYGPIFVADVQKDLALVDQIIAKDYANRWKPTAGEKPDYSNRSSRPILSRERSLGSVIKLLVPSSEYTDEYNAWLASIPNYVYPIVLIIKRFYQGEWGDDWRQHFNVDVVNGFPGHELKFGQRKLVGTYLRVGLMRDGSWRTFKVRQDFAAADKVQTEDDISASVIVPAAQLDLQPKPKAAIGDKSLKFAANCEFRLFQRPDDAVHRGLDKQTEIDLAREDNFISNFEPLDADAAKKILEHVTDFDRFTPPMQAILRSAAAAGSGYVVSSANPRLVDGKPSKNPRYLQIRPDLVTPINAYTAKRGMRLYHAIPANHPVYMPVDAVLVGRRNNPADPAAHIRPLAIYNPIHYQELPELFMDFICSLTGKSPSTTGAGSEGALTKGPFNALRPIVDLNNALVGYILTGLAGFSSSAGYIGPNVRMDHDVSLLIPEVWCRLSPKERDPAFLIAEGHLEPLKDFADATGPVLASRLGYRITSHFVRTYFGRVFDNPSKVFDDALLQPEMQDRAAFIDGIRNITEAHQRVASEYLQDGSIQDACPPLRALLHIMATGSYEGKDAHHPDIRAMFSRDALLASDWYRQRLAAKQQQDIALWKRHVAYLDEFLQKPNYGPEAQRLDIPARRRQAADQLQRAATPAYLTSLTGTTGLDPTMAAG